LRLARANDASRDGKTARNRRTSHVSIMTYLRELEASLQEAGNVGASVSGSMHIMFSELCVFPFLDAGVDKQEDNARANTTNHETEEKRFKPPYGGSSP